MIPGLPIASTYGSSVFPWPPALRTPFTLLPGPYNKTLPYVPPADPSIKYRRGDGWGMAIYDEAGQPLPFVPEGSSEHPERCLTGFFNRWDPKFGVDPKWQRLIIDGCKTRGYNWFLLWLADALAGQNRTISVNEYADQSARLVAEGLNVSHWLASKNIPWFIDRDQDWKVWAAKLDPILDALIAAGGIQNAVLGGEFNLFNVPGQNTYDIAKWAVDKCGPHGISVTFHFSTWVTWWGAGRAAAEAASLQAVVQTARARKAEGLVPYHEDAFSSHVKTFGGVMTTADGTMVQFVGDGDRFAWTHEMCELGVEGLDFQGDALADCATYQGRITDTLGHPGIDRRWIFRNVEDSASEQFSHDHPDETEACNRSYSHQCALPQDLSVQQWGYMNGGYRDTGKFL